MVTGFVGDDLARVTRQLEAQGLSTTANPLTADVCVRQGARLGRTLKVLCALARGIPIVSPAWVNDLESKPLAHLVVDRDTEREWDFSLADTLRRACAGPLLSGLCVYVAPSVVTRPNPVCLAVMAKAAGGFVLNDFARDEECLLRGEEANGVPLLNRRCSSSVDNDREGVLTCDESSEEPDNDSDEDWSATNNHPRTRASRRKRRKTLPKLPKVDYESSQNDDARRVGLKSEPSMIFAPPISAATTPIRATAGNSPSSRLSLSATSGKRRKIRESPASVSSSTNFGTVSEAGSASVAFDPKCSAQDMAILLAARKDELGIPADTQLLVVEAAGERLRSLWRVHGALVVEPEAIIQSIIHCSRQF
ncbi:Mediator of DNA damage checkpoint protein 1 [Coemansia sp. BCRC 34301]|nr:Mediator of DNA damage checkpoint protein 1 [Coemansia sp. BCRC 34301]